MTDNVTDPELGEPEKLTLSEAMEMLTLGEIGLIERHYGRRFGAEGDAELAPFEMMGGVIWAFAKRAAIAAGQPYGWADLDKVTMKEANAYFAPEPIEIDETEPESDAGKDDSPGARAHESEPSSAPS
jgi:hypothetical protein